MVYSMLIVNTVIAFSNRGVALLIALLGYANARAYLLLSTYHIEVLRCGWWLSKANTDAIQSDRQIRKQEMYV